jgi:hypothetical protein
MGNLPEAGTDTSGYMLNLMINEHLGHKINSLSF